MKNFMSVKKLMAVVLVIATLSSITGCMGRHALTKSVEDFNLETVDNRWGREGLFILLFPVSYVTNFLDLFFIN